MADEQKQSKCARCESDKPAKEYNLNIPSRPLKTGNLCDECAAADPKAVLKTPVEVPKIEPPVPETTEPAETAEPKLSGEASLSPPDGEPISIPTPKNAPPPEPEQISTEGSVPRAQVVTDMKRQEGEIVKLAESHQGLLARQVTEATQQRRTAAQIAEVLRIVAIKQGAVAAYRKTLGLGSVDARD